MEEKLIHPSNNPIRYPLQSKKCFNNRFWYLSSLITKYWHFPHPHPLLVRISHLSLHSTLDHYLLKRLTSYQAAITATQFSNYALDTSS